MMAPLVLYVVECSEAKYEVFDRLEDAQADADEARRMWPNAEVRVLLYPRPLSHPWDSQVAR